MNKPVAEAIPKNTNGNDERIWTIATHGGFRHPDELLAIWLLKKHGEQKFPGINNARVIFINAGHHKQYLGKTAEDHAKNGVMLIDVGGGDFDHSVDGQDCSAVRVARCVEIKNPDEQSLIAYTQRNDLTGKSNEMDLARLLKEISRHPDANPAKVLDWGLGVLDALTEYPLPAVFVNKEARRAQLKINQKLVDSLVAKWIVEKIKENKIFNKFVIDELASSLKTDSGQVASILHLLNNRGKKLPEEFTEIIEYVLRNSKGNRFDYDLSEIIGALFLKSGNQIEQVYDIIFPVLDEIYFWQNEFQKAIIEFSKAKTVLVNHQTGKISIASITSNNLMISKATRVGVKHLSVLAQVSERQIYITSDKRIIQEEEMADVVALLRIEELEARGHGKFLPDWKQLRSRNTLFGIEEAWHFQEESRAIFNRSLGNRDAPATLLDQETIHRTIAIALDLDYMPGCKNKKDCIKNNCSVYCAGFIRCRTKRFKDYKKNNITKEDGNGSKNKKPKEEHKEKIPDIVSKIGKNIGITIISK